MSRNPSPALRKVLPPAPPKRLWNRFTPTALERTVDLINSDRIVLFGRSKQCPQTKELSYLLAKQSRKFRIVYLDKLTNGNVMQRRLQDLTGQWSVPSLFVKSTHVGGLEDSRRALSCGRVDRILEADDWVELVYATKPDSWARGNMILEPKTRTTQHLCLADSYSFNYVFKRQWAQVLRYWGKHPKIEDL